MSAVQRSQIEKFIYKAEGSLREELEEEEEYERRSTEWDVHENINKLKATDRVKDQAQVYTNNPQDTQVA